MDGTEKRKLVVIGMSVYSGGGGPIPAVREAVKAVRVGNRFHKGRAWKSKIVSEIMDIEEHLENLYWASRGRCENRGLPKIDLRL